MDKEPKIILFLLIIVIFPIIQMVATLRWHNETTYHEIYCATLPFGFIYLEGDMSGSFFIGIGSVSGQVGMTENYNIKYIDEGQLKTLIFRAEEMPLIIDGTFQVEKTLYWKTSYMYFWKTREDAPWLTEYQVHIPYLPELNQTLTEDWIR